MAGLASVATLPVAVYGTRFSDRYDLLHAAFAVPVTVVLGLVAVALARRARVHTAVSLAGEGGGGVATAGRVLGIIGLCMAASAIVALGCTAFSSTLARGNSRGVRSAGASIPG